MNKLSIAAVIAAAVSIFSACSGNSAKSWMSDSEIEAKVKKTLAGLTLEEKIGQMTQITIDVIGDWTPEGFVPSDEKIEQVIGHYKVGSILNAPGIAQTPESWLRIITALQDKSMSTMGIPCLYGLDHIHGCTYIVGSTLFPQGINLGASFNPSLAFKGAEVTAYESRACSVPYTFSPTMDITRNQSWSRVWESYGEDPLVNAEMAKAAVLGYQGEDFNHVDQQHVAVSAKHYLGYGAAVSGKDRTPSSITSQDLREKYFKPFKEAVQAGALTVMVNSGNNQGIPFHANKELLTGWLKEELNWDGVIITDWADINNLYTRDKVAADKKEAIKMAINAGVDLAMEPYQCDFCDLLKELVEEGEVKMSRIDDAVSRVLRLKYRLGLFEKPVQNFADYPQFGCQEYKDASLHAAEESIVLLKNEGVLPIKQGTKILVTGPNSNEMRCLNGGWTYTWQGNADLFASDCNTIYEALSNKFGAANVRLEEGLTWNGKGNWWDENEPQIAKAVAAARQSDLIVACIGENTYCETPGNLTELSISENQKELVKALEATGKPVILVLVGGRPRIINSLVPAAKGVIDAFLPGNFGADALANLMAGDVNFSAKMPYTYPNATNSLINYDYKPSQQVATMGGAYNYEADASSEWAFGYGISYTTYEYSNLKVNKTAFTAADELTFSVDVKNTGSVAGKEPVLLFGSDLVATSTPDVRRLRAFTKIELAPGETKTVTFSIPASDLAYVGYDCKWILEEGEFRMQAGDQTVTINCTQTKVWDTPNID